MAEVLDLNADKLKQIITSHKEKHFLYVKRRITPSVADSVRALDVDGVTFRTEFKRFYPTGEISSHIVGFTNVDDKGIEGIERVYNSLLTGTDGTKRYRKDAKGRKIEILADSYNDHGVRLTTTKLRFPRYILPEINTHRQFSRNASSSRAIPLQRQIEFVTSDPVYFFSPGYNKSGMQAGERLTPEDMAKVEKAWLEARDAAVKAAEVFAEVGLHKQHASRVLEPWLWQEIVVSTTDVDNFFKQRISELAQPEIDCLAVFWKEALDNSFSRYVPFGEYHLPYVTQDERDQWELSDLIKFSVARCARTSYLTPQGNYDPQKDRNLYDRLVTAKPPHWSPLEHVATPAHLPTTCGGNFKSWVQVRQLVEQSLG